MTARQSVRGAAIKVDKRSAIYVVLYTWISTFFFQFYRKKEVRGLENIPKNEPVILAPNHTNALLDAWIVLFSSPGDTVFLARADLFKGKFLARMLNNFKMLPVFRIRDGVEELGKNQAIFDVTVGVLHRNHQLCLMPEGSHGELRRLRPLQKGIFRIAFKAQEKMGNKPYVKIIPVGLDFSNFVKQNQTLLVNYGKPIEVSEYWDSFMENGPRGLNELKSRLAEEMKPLMIEIETKDYYEVYDGLRNIFNERMREIMGIEGKKLEDIFVANKEMIDRLNKLLEKDEKKIKSISDKVLPYIYKLKEMNIREWVVRGRGYTLSRTLWRYLSLIITLPVFLYGFINNFIAYLLPVYLVRNIKDIQFHSSVKAAAAIILTFPMFYTIQTLLVGIFTDQWWIWVVYLVTVYPMGKLALLWYLRFKKTWHGGRFGIRYRSGNKEAVDLVGARAEIIKIVEDFI